MAAQSSGMPLDWSPTEKREEVRPATGHGSPAGRRRLQCHPRRPPRLGGIGACTGGTQPAVRSCRESRPARRGRSRGRGCWPTHRSGRAVGRHGSSPVPCGGGRFPGAKRSARVTLASRFSPPCVRRDGLKVLRRAAGRPGVAAPARCPGGHHVSCAADGDPAVRRWAAARAHSSTVGPAFFQRGQRERPAARVPMADRHPPQCCHAGDLVVCLQCRTRIARQAGVGTQAPEGGQDAPAGRSGGKP